MWIKAQSGILVNMNLVRVVKVKESATQQDTRPLLFFLMADEFRLFEGSEEECQAALARLKMPITHEFIR